MFTPFAICMTLVGGQNLAPSRVTEIIITPSKTLHLYFLGPKLILQRVVKQLQKKSQMPRVRQSTSLWLLWMEIWTSSGKGV